MTGSAGQCARVLKELGCVVFERGWLSSNNILFNSPTGPSTLVDTGYSAHSEQTALLIRAELAGRSLDRIVNTHLHSDHCGGNALLQREFGSETLVPSVSVEVVRSWDESRLTYQSTGQSCPRFAADGGLSAGQSIRLGTRDWEVFEAPGHDPDALMLFEPVSRTLISGDGLWESRLAIIFPELTGESGFAEARSVLDRIEALSPAWVLPGHGAPFRDVATAIARSRSRLDRYEESPARHISHAFRALVMFRLLEIRSVDERVLVDWIGRCPLFLQAADAVSGSIPAPEEIIDALVQSGSIQRTDAKVHLVS